MCDQLICIHFGQAGIQIGNALWELLCIEHAITPDGIPLDLGNKLKDNENMFAFFDMGNTGNYIPRALLIDSESAVIDEVKNGVYRQLFNKNMMLHHVEDAANNYARGSYTIGKKMIRAISCRLRKLIEQTDSLRGFYVFNSDGGGTGSGLSPLVFLSLMKNYPKICRSNFSIVPGGNLSSAVVEPYNICLQNFAAVDTTDVNFLFENESLYDVCSKKLFINNPTFTDVNRIFAKVIGCISCPLRYASVLRSGIDDLLTNLIPYPRIHFPFVRYAPVNHISRTSYENISTFELTKELFSRQTQSLKIDTNKGLFIAMVLNYQGMVRSKDIYKYIDEVKQNRSNKFVEWSPNGFKVGICKQLPSINPMLEMATTDQFATMLLNSTAIGEFFKSLARKFDCLYLKKCFIHWYLGEGMEEVEFQESRDEIELLIGDLREISMTEKEIIELAKNDPGNSRIVSYRNNAKRLVSE